MVQYVLADLCERSFRGLAHDAIVFKVESAKRLEEQIELFA